MGHFKKAICSDIFQNWDISRIFEYTSKIGYDSIELNPYILGNDLEAVDPGQTESIRRMAERTNLKVVGIHSILKAPGKTFHITHPDRSIRTKTIQHLNLLINICADMGGWIIPLGASRQRNVMPGVTMTQAWNYAREVFSEILKTAEKQGVILCMEPLTYRLTNFISKASEALRMVEEIDHPNFKMMLDVRSASDDDKPIPELIRDCSEFMAHFHANDHNARGPGFGNADYPGIAKVLKEVNYKGYLSVEVFDFWTGPETIAEQSLKNLERFF